MYGEIFDEGLPLGAVSSSTWSRSSGTGDVSFSDVHKINSTVSFSDTGKYVIRLTASDGELSGYDEVQLNVHFAISKQPADQTICENTNVVFNVEVKSKSPVSYKWYRDNVPLSDAGNITGTNSERLSISNATIQDAGNFYCLISNCKSFKSNVAELVVNQVPDNPVISFVDGILKSNATNGNQWYCNNQLILNEVNSTLIPQSDGDYFVIVTLNSCLSHASNIISYITTGIKETVSGNDINVYPNPATDVIKISINRLFDSDFTIDVYNKTGRLLKSLNKDKTESKIEVDLTNLPTGLYLIRLQSSERQYQIKIIKK